MSPNTLRFLFAAALLLGAAPAPADEAAITLTLSPAQVAALSTALDQKPLAEWPPAAFWELKRKIREALDANPDAQRAVWTEREAAR